MEKAKQTAGTNPWEPFKVAHMRGVWNKIVNDQGTNHEVTLVLSTRNELHWLSSLWEQIGADSFLIYFLLPSKGQWLFSMIYVNSVINSLIGSHLTESSP